MFHSLLNIVLVLILLVGAAGIIYRVWFHGARTGAKVATQIASDTMIVEGTSMTRSEFNRQMQDFRDRIGRIKAIGEQIENPFVVRALEAAMKTSGKIVDHFVEKPATYLPTKALFKNTLEMTETIGNEYLQLRGKDLHTEKVREMLTKSEDTLRVITKGLTAQFEAMVLNDAMRLDADLDALKAIAGLKTN
jgi:5-bromo-4-chloroindolyl phosphate hydrolysis protein